jgi:hypothetical protein
MLWPFGALREDAANIDFTASLRHGNGLGYEAREPVAFDYQPKRRFGGGK